jgi:hypothetical protein
MNCRGRELELFPWRRDAPTGPPALEPLKGGVQFHPAQVLDAVVCVGPVPRLLHDLLGERERAVFGAVLACVRELAEVGVWT